MPQPLPRELLQVLPGALVHSDQNLVLIHADISRTIDAHGLPLHGSRHIEIRRDVEPLGDTGGDQRIPLRDLIRIERGLIRGTLDKAAIMMVDTNRVVAQPRQPFGQSFGHISLDKIGGKTEVDAIETLHHPRLLFEFKVRSFGQHVPILACGFIVKSQRREVQRRALIDIQIRAEGNPISTGLQNHRSIEDQFFARTCDHVKGELPRFTFLEAPRFTIVPDPHTEMRRPLAVILNHHLGRFRKEKGDCTPLDRGQRQPFHFA